VEIVRARFSRGIDHGAAASPKFGRVIRGLNLEFRDCVYVAQYGNVSVIVGVVVDAIEDEVVLMPACR
jgi:hypothetical protein